MTTSTAKPPAGLTFCSLCDPQTLDGYSRVRQDDPTYERGFESDLTPMSGDRQLLTCMDGNAEQGWYVRILEGAEKNKICPKCQKWPLFEVVHDNAFEFRAL